MKDYNRISFFGLGDTYWSYEDFKISYRAHHLMEYDFLNHITTYKEIFHDIFNLLEELIESKDLSNYIIAFTMITNYKYEEL